MAAASSVGVSSVGSEDYRPPKKLEQEVTQRPRGSRLPVLVVGSLVAVAIAVALAMVAPDQLKGVAGVVGEQAQKAAKKAKGEKPVPVPDGTRYEIVAEPHVSEYPKDDGGVFRVLGMSFFDPNGYFIELNQFIE